MSEFKSLHHDHLEEVPRRVWNQVESKLNENKQKKKFIRLRAISAIAACFVFAAVLSYVNLSFTEQGAQSFVTNESYKSMVFEDLQEISEPLYDYSQLKEINTVVISNNPSFARRSR